MPRYLVEQTFFEAQTCLGPDVGRVGIQAAIDLAGVEGVIWIQSYVSIDGCHVFSICDAPTPGAVRRTATQGGWPIDRITEIRLLDPQSLSGA